MRIISLLFIAFFLAVSAHAETTPFAKLDNSQVRMVAGADDTGALRAAIEIQLNDGWKTYWRTSGDAGYPVSIDTTGSTNLKSAVLQWPAPKRFIDFGSIETFAYKHDVIFPLTLEAEDKAKPVHLKLKLKYAACKELCTFLTHDFEVDVSGKLSADEVKLLAAAQANLPAPLEKQKDIVIDNIGLMDGEHIRIEAHYNEGFEKPDVFIESPNFRFPQADVTLSEGNHKAVIVAPVQPLLSDQKVIKGKELTFTLADKGHSVEWKAVMQAAKGYDFRHFLLMLGFAVLGGLILNIMPCVLPVLSLKILGVLRKSGKELPIVRRSFLASTAGIIASFIALAGLVVILQAAGKTVGWGFQFQEPYFLIALSLLLTFFAANMFGFYEFHLPHFMGDYVVRKSHKSEGYLEHFLTGAFATLMATPCSAPFLGTAIGFAFSQGALEVFALFIAMGVGLAIPYLLIAAFPHLVKFLPRPGAWMTKARKVLGILLLCTAIWILWVLSAQEGMLTSLAIAAMLVLILLSYRLPRKRILSTVSSLVVVTLLLPVALMEKHEQAHEQAKAVAAVHGLWQDFDQNKIKMEVLTGNVVLVDVTADWCLTCKANKLLVLDTPEVTDMLKAPKTIAMKADWTNRDKVIADYLKSYGRYGIPFNVVYGPAAPKGIALPELLSEDIVRKAIEKARGKTAGKDDPRPSELP